MKVVESVLESRIRLLVNVDEMQLVLMPGKGTIDALFLVRRKKNIEIKENPCSRALLIWKRHSIMSRGR